jgi:hypothetical protein
VNQTLVSARIGYDCWIGLDTFRVAEAPQAIEEEAVAAADVEDGAEASTWSDLTQ